MSKDIYVLVEQRDGVLQSVGMELLGEASRLAACLGQRVVGVLLGHDILCKAPLLHQYGADEVVCVDDPMLAEYATEPYTKAMTAVIQTCGPEIVLFGATTIGRDLAPRVSCRIKTGLTADCTALEIDPDTKFLRMTRPAFGGNLMAVIECRVHRPQMATVRPGVMRPLDRDAGRTGKIQEITVPLAPADQTVEILETRKTKRSAADITSAKYLVSGGRGIGTPEFFQELQTLAESLGPEAEISASRATVDAGWIDKGRQVGQTGHTVRPQLYIACGISGAVQHLTGMEDADFILAINKNESAPIFGAADLGIVGDVREIVPRLARAIQEAKAAKMTGFLTDSVSERTSAAT